MSRNGRRSVQARHTTTTATMACHRMEVQLTPSTSPNRISVRLPANSDDLDTITTPSASMPTNSRPIATSLLRRVRRCTAATPPIITAAPTSAPTNDGMPMSSAAAMPGSTPCASASPKKAIPRSTISVPTTPVAMATRMPASRARCMKAFCTNGSVRTPTLATCHPCWPVPTRCGERCHRCRSRTNHRLAAPRWRAPRPSHRWNLRWRWPPGARFPAR